MSTISSGYCVDPGAPPPVQHFKSKWKSNTELKEVWSGHSALRFPTTRLLLSCSCLRVQHAACVSSASPRDSCRCFPTSTVPFVTTWPLTGVIPFLWLGFALTKSHTAPSVSFASVHSRHTAHLPRTCSLAVRTQEENKPTEHCEPITVRRTFYALLFLCSVTLKKNSLWIHQRRNMSPSWDRYEILYISIIFHFHWGKYLIF